MLVALKTMTRGEVADFIVEPEYAFGAMGCPPRVPANCRLLLQLRLVDWSSEEVDIMDAMDEEQREQLSAEQVIAFVEKILKNRKIFKYF